MNMFGANYERFYDEYPPIFMRMNIRAVESFQTSHHNDGVLFANCRWIALPSGTTAVAFLFSAAIEAMRSRICLISIQDFHLAK